MLGVGRRRADSTVGCICCGGAGTDLPCLEDAPDESPEQDVLKFMHQLLVFCLYQQAADSVVEHSLVHNTTK